MISVSDFLKEQALEVLGLLPARAPEDEDKMLFVNDIEGILRQRVVEAATWYSGNSDDIFNLYRYDARIQFWTEPFYYRNKRSYFWARSSYENDIKRTHCPFCKDATDLLVCLCGIPTPKQNMAGPAVLDTLNAILESNGFWGMYQKEQMPMTLVKGWGAYKIYWDIELFGNDPVVSFYQAENVRFVKRANRVVGIVFFDWMKDAKGKRYLVAETRTKKGNSATFRTQVFREEGDSNLRPISEEEAKALFGIESQTIVGMPCLMAEPCSFYEDNLYHSDGKGIWDGKIDQLDDLDQAYSQVANTVRRSTPVETFDIDFCERRKDGTPVLPNIFERRYVQIMGQKNVMGEVTATKPVEVTQPQLNTDMYDAHIKQLKMGLINGLLSPSAMGLDVDRPQTAKAEENEKNDTVVTRNFVCSQERRALKSLFNQLLMAKEYLTTNKITKSDFGIDVVYDEFSNSSYEAKVKAMSAVLANGGVSPEMYVEKVYGNSISEEAKQKEVAWVEEHSKQAPPEEGFGMGMIPEESGMAPVQGDAEESAES